MREDYGKCELCGGGYTLKDKKEMVGSKYRILKCDKCKHEVARRVE